MKPKERVMSLSEVSDIEKSFLGDIGEGFRRSVGAIMRASTAVLQAVFAFLPPCLRWVQLILGYHLCHLLVIMISSYIIYHDIVI